MKKSEFLSWNEKMFVKYNNERLYHHPNPIIRYTEGKRVATILSLLKGAARVADIGCGEGYILSRIRSETVVGLDISKTALTKARRVPGAVLVRADAENPPFSESYFDAAICSETLEHTLEPKRVIEALSRMVRPGGLIIITIPNERLINRIKDLVWNLGLFSILFPNVPRRQDEEWHLHSFDLPMLKRLSRGTLEIDEVRGIPFSFLPVRYVAACTNPKGAPAQADEMFRKPLRKAEGYYDALE